MDVKTIVYLLTTLLTISVGVGVGPIVHAEGKAPTLQYLVDDDDNNTGHDTRQHHAAGN